MAYRRRVVVRGTALCSQPLTAPRRREARAPGRARGNVLSGRIAPAHYLGSRGLWAHTGKSPSMIPATWLLSATRLAAARGDAAMSAHLSQQLGGVEREPPAWLAHEIARRSRLPRPDDPAARAREGGAFLATSRRSSGAASARPVVLHFYSLACRRCRRRRRGNDRFPSRTEKLLVVSLDRIDLCSQAARPEQYYMHTYSKYTIGVSSCTVA